MPGEPRRRLFRGPMYHGVYILWALLPFTLLCLSVWAVMKRWFKIPGREDAGRYFAQFIFSLICLIVSIIFDQFFLEDLVTVLSAGMFDVALARWLLFPALLVLFASFPMKKKQKTPAQQRF